MTMKTVTLAIILTVYLVVILIFGAPAISCILLLRLLVRKNTLICKRLYIKVLSYSEYVYFYSVWLNKVKLSDTS